MRYLGLLIIMGPLILEFLIFSFLTDIIGVILAIILSVLTSLFGVLLIRMTATSIFKIRHINFNLEKSLLRNFYSDIWNLFGGILLVIPGFITDLIGITLILPFTRKWLIIFVNIFLSQSRNNTKNYKKESTGPIIDVPYEDLTSSKNVDNKKY